MTTTQSTIPQDTLTADSLRYRLAASRDSFKVGPMRRQGQYHGRVLSGFHNTTVARHAANILRECDRLDVAEFATPDGTSLAVIARKP